jgi:hypothetical protein
MEWWISLQPASRGGVQLLREVDVGEVWLETRKGSINGFFNVVVSLSWWMEALTSDEESSKFLTTLKDVLWVLDCMLKPNATKRGRDASDDLEEGENIAKRYVQLLLQWTATYLTIPIGQNTRVFRRILELHSRSFETQ